MSLTSLSKKTKTELVEEYNKLLEKYDELKMTSQALGDKRNLEIFEKAKDYTFDKIALSITNLKNELNSILNQLSDKLFSETQKLNELQQAMELSKKHLEVNYGIQIAADTLQNLVTEHESKKKEFEKELAFKKLEIEEEVEKVRRDRRREEEEYEYDTAFKHRRKEEAYQEEATKRENALEERERNMKEQEIEIQNMRKQMDDFPKQLDNALRQREQETTKNLKVEFEHTIGSMKKDWNAEKNIFEMQIKNLEEQLKRQSSEAIMLRQEAERANKKAQELAIKIVESGAKISAAPEEKSSQNPIL